MRIRPEPILYNGKPMLRPNWQKYCDTVCYDQFAEAGGY